MLSASLRFQPFTIRKRAADNLKEGRLRPHPFALQLDSLLLVDNRIVNHSWKFELVRLGGIGVENDFPVGQMLRARGFQSFLVIGPGPGARRTVSGG